MGRRRDQIGRDVMGGGSVPPSSLSQFDEAAFGQLKVLDSGRQTAEAISIYEIFPDPKQPRRVMPSKIRALWNGEPKTLGQVFQRWQDAANRERNDAKYPVEIAAFFEERDEAAARFEGDRPVTTALIAVCELASSIYRDGLTNPITVARAGRNYMIETGERRWLAFHLLTAMFGEKWQRIPARVVPSVDVLRQATENTAREELNAIGKARQLSLILMYLYQQEGHQFEGYQNANGCDRDFYAQVADGNVWRIPKGKGELVASALGVKTATQVREIRQFLSIDDELWTEADDYSWTHGRLRDYILNTRRQERKNREEEPPIPYHSVSNDTVSSPAEPVQPMPKSYEERQRQLTILNAQLEKVATNLHDAQVNGETKRAAELEEHRANIEVHLKRVQGVKFAPAILTPVPSPTSGEGRPDGPPYVSIEDVEAGRHLSESDPSRALRVIREMDGLLDTLVELLNASGGDWEESGQADVLRNFRGFVNGCGELLGNMKKVWG